MSTLMRLQKICVAHQVSDNKQRILTLDSVVCDSKRGVDLWYINMIKRRYER